MLNESDVYLEGQNSPPFQPSEIWLFEVCSCIDSGIFFTFDPVVLNRYWSDRAKMIQQTARSLPRGQSVKNCGEIFCLPKKGSRIKMYPISNSLDIVERRN